MRGPVGNDVGHACHRRSCETACEMRDSHRLCFPRMTVELRHLRAFLTIAEEGSITRAAHRLHIGQPALSRTLRQLEAHLGVQLVDRGTHHLELTRAGTRFRVRAEAAVATFDDVVDPGQLGAWPLRLGHAWSAMGDYTTPLLRRWQQRYPHVPLELLRIDDRTAGLCGGKVDAALLRGRISGAGLHVEHLLTESRYAVVPVDGTLAAHAALSLADLSAEPIAVNTVSGLTDLRLWPVGIRPARVVEVVNTDDWLAAIAAGRAVGVSTSGTASTHTHPGVAYVPLSDAPEVPVTMVWKVPPGHPGVPDLAALAHEVVREHERPHRT